MRPPFEAIPKPNLQTALHVNVFLAGIVAVLVEKKAMLGSLLAAILIRAEERERARDVKESRKLVL